MDGWTCYPLSTAPAPYDTVWCRFPYNEAPNQPGPVPHPGLIRQAFADQDGNPWVRVVYGTSVEPFRTGNQYFSVAKLVDMDMCGLKCATRFCLARTSEVPYCVEYFPSAPGKETPILGHMSEHLQRILQIQISYLQRDMNG